LGPALEGEDMVAKPFHMSELAFRVAEVLGRSSTGGVRPGS
jgi:hypothetical protein